MSLDIFVLDDPYFRHLIPNSTMLSPEISDNFFTDPLSEISDSINTLLQEIFSDDFTNPNITQISSHESHFPDQISHTHFSNSPPSHQFETLSLSHQQNVQQNQTHLPNSQSSCNLASGFDNHSALKIESEDFLPEFNSPGYDPCFMQRSCSYNSSSLDVKPSLVLLPTFEGQIRRVYSTGNLPEVGMKQMAEGRAREEGERNFLEEANIKVGRYSAEERKERIDRYRAKRTQRNFNKTLKYACRKTLADSRARIRGRFARNDETEEVDGTMQEEDKEGILAKKGGRFSRKFGGIHFHYCGYS